MALLLFFQAPVTLSPYTRPTQRKCRPARHPRACAATRASPKQNALYLSTQDMRPISASVIAAIRDVYTRANGALHRGSCAHTLGRYASELMEASRTRVAASINAEDWREVAFAPSVYQATTVLAQSFGSIMKKGDHVLLSSMECDHTVIPWRVAAEKWGFKLKVFRPDMAEGGEFKFASLASQVSAKTRLIVFQHASPVLGTFNPLGDFIQFARGCGIPVAVDATHSLPWTKINVQELQCDFLLADCRAIGAPPGSTLLYGRMDRFRRLPPVLGGEDTFENFYIGKLKTKLARSQSNWASVPERFEVGFPPLIVGAAVAAALHQHDGDMDHEAMECAAQLGEKLFLELSANPRLTVFGHTKMPRIPSATFSADDVAEADLIAQLRKHHIFVDVGSEGARVAHAEELGRGASLRVCFDPRIHCIEDVAKFSRIVKVALDELKKR